MQYIEFKELIKSLEKFKNVYSNYKEKENFYQTWEDNYRDEDENDWNPYEQELDLEEMAEAFNELNKKSRSQLVALTRKKDIKVLKELYSAIANLWSECSKDSDLKTYIQKSFPAGDSLEINNAINFAKLRVLMDFPYFDPDSWIDEHVKINPIVLSLNSRLAKEIEIRLNEATFCYIYGFYNACVALCRSVLEGLLKEKLKNEIPYVQNKSLDEILKWLGKKSLEERQVAWDVDKVRSKANLILHNIRKKTNKNQAKRILLDTRKLLEELI